MVDDVQRRYHDERRAEICKGAFAAHQCAFNGPKQCSSCGAAVEGSEVTEVRRRRRADKLQMVRARRPGARFVELLLLQPARHHQNTPSAAPAAAAFPPRSAMPRS